MAVYFKPNISISLCWCAADWLNFKHKYKENLKQGPLFSTVNYTIQKHWKIKLIIRLKKFSKNSAENWISEQKVGKKSQFQNTSNCILKIWKTVSQSKTGCISQLWTNYCILLLSSGKVASLLLPSLRWSKWSAFVTCFLKVWYFNNVVLCPATNWLRKK